MYESKLKMWDNAQCPFYLREYKNRIVCGNDMDDSREITTRFTLSDTKVYKFKHHCSKKFPEECPIYQMLKDDLF